MRTARPLMAGARPAAFQSCRALSVQKAAPVLDQPSCSGRTLSKRMIPRKTAPSGSDDFTVVDAALCGLLLAGSAAIITVGVQMNDTLDGLPETMSLRATMQSYEELLAQGLTPTQELMV
jgi:hypothetical protein